MPEDSAQPTEAGRGWDALSAALALVGVAESVYLTVEHFAGRSVRCVVVTGCDTVLTSSYATVAGGIPLAAVGAFAYFTAFSLATLAYFGYTGTRPLLGLLAALMFAASVWYVYVQAFVLQAFCAYCLLSAAVSTALALVALTRLLLGRKSRLS